MSNRGLWWSLYALILVVFISIQLNHQVTQSKVDQVIKQNEQIIQHLGTVK